MNPSLGKYSSFFLLFTLCVTIIFPVQAQKYVRTIEAHREDKAKGFLADSTGPLDASGIRLLSYFEPDETYVVDATYRLLTDQSPFDMGTYDGNSASYIRYAVLRFRLPGDTTLRELTVYRSVRLMDNPKYVDHLFLPFKDKTNGIETYGGGRYMDLKVQDFKKGRLTLDFNKNYNPYCAYSNGYRCPVPPYENHLNASVAVGELAFNGPIKERAIR